MSDALPIDYAALLGDVKARIEGARVRAVLAASHELLVLYWDIGRLIDARQQEEGWGAGVIPRLAADLAREMPDARGFSERNLMRMLRFAREYPAAQLEGGGSDERMVPQAVAPLAGPAPNLPTIEAIEAIEAELAAVEDET